MQSEEYYQYIKWLKEKHPEINNLTNQEVKFIEFLLQQNNLGTTQRVFDSVKKYIRSPKTK